MDILVCTLLTGTICTAFVLLVQRAEKVVLGKISKYIHSTPAAQIVEHTLEIPYQFYGQDYTIHVPYNLSVHSYLHDYDCTVYYPDQSISTIVQQPGVPYLVKAEDLGASMIVLKHKHEEDDQHVHPFRESVPKLYTTNLTMSL